MDTNFLTYAGLVAGLGMIATCWNQIKSFAGRIWGYLICSVTIHDGGIVGPIFESYIREHFNQSRFGEKDFRSDSIFVKPAKRNMQVIWEAFGQDSLLFWKKATPLWIKRSYDDKARENTIRLSYIRGMIDIDQLLIDALDDFNERNSGNTSSNRYTIRHIGRRRRNDEGRGPDSGPGGNTIKTVDVSPCRGGRLLKWTWDEVGPEIEKNKSAIESVILPEHAMVAVKEAFFWRNSESWYTEKGIPWKRGWLLHGIPGTGKTSLARALAKDLNMPVFVYDLAGLTNEEFRHEWQAMMSFTPCMALIEDIDSVFDGRRNISAMHKDFAGLTFDCLLNTLDGIDKTDGVFLIITTNNIDKIDSALAKKMDNDDEIASRPGRIDRVIEIGLPSKDGLMMKAKQILKDHPETWEEIVDHGFRRKETIAQFQYRCAKLALELYWKSFEGNGVDIVSVSDKKDLIPHGYEIMADFASNGRSQ